MNTHVFSGVAWGLPVGSAAYVSMGLSDHRWLEAGSAVCRWFGPFGLEAGQMCAGAE